ncbi:MAG: hypothetical protein H6510_00630 [Acidobacteria bacterium]|nr:hypothetical protein [Acidobacteriota bacterium]MCB9396294.1 hypothetical protein [Acidobacteriota bacterium]
MLKPEPTSVRLDRYLFSIRYYKSRAQAVEAIDGGKVKVNGEPAKAHKLVKLGDLIQLKRDGRKHELKVLRLLDKRLSAKDVEGAYELTLDPDLSEEARSLVELARRMAAQVPKPKGRPTKKDRRELEKWRDRSDE